MEHSQAVALIFGHPSGNNEVLPVIKAILFPAQEQTRTPEAALKEIAVEFVQDEVGKTHYVDTLAIPDMYPQQYPPGTVVLSYSDATETLIRCHRVIGRETRGWFGSVTVEKTLEYLGYFAIVQIGLPIVLAAPKVVETAVAPPPRQMTNIVRKNPVQDATIELIKNFDRSKLRHHAQPTVSEMVVEEDGYASDTYGKIEEDISQ